MFFLLLAFARSACPQFVISEFLAENRLGRKDEDGDYEDWIEIHNPGGSPRGLRGWSLTDRAGQPRQWEFPDVTLAGGEFLVVFASGKDRRVVGKPLHTNFRLDRDGEYLALVRPDGGVASSFSPAYPPQFADVGFGYAAASASRVLVSAPAPGRFLVPSDDRLGTNWIAPEFDDRAWTDVVIGVGWDATGEVGTVEVANSESDWSTQGEQGYRGWRYGSYARFADGNGSYSIGEFVPFPSGHWNGALWRNPGGGPPWDVLGRTEARPTGSNSGGERWVIRRWTSSVAGGVTVQWRFAKRSAGGTGANARLFHQGIQRDTATVAGDNLAGVTRTVNLTGVAVGDFIDLAVTPSGIGGALDDTGDEVVVSMSVSARGQLGALVRTDVAASMRGRNASAYLRVPFVVTNVTEVEDLRLRVRFDDGFAAYLNGHPVARHHAPVESPGGVVADQVDDWSGNGEQGVKGWYYGFYDAANDPDRTYDAAADFDNLDSRWTWNGAAWVLGPGDPPWTTIARDSWHPNGNSGGANLQWAIRRWVSQAAGTVKVMLAVAKENTACGNGVTVRVLVNGASYFSRAIAADDVTGFTTTVVLEDLNFGDFVDFVLDPTGPDGDTQDGCDGSTFAVQVLQDSSPGLTWDSAASGSRTVAEAGAAMEFDLDGVRDRLVAGTNVLSFQVLNASAADADLLLLPELTSRTTWVRDAIPVYFVTPTPGSANGAGAETVGPLVDEVRHAPVRPADGDDLVVTARVRATRRPVAEVRLVHRTMYDAEAILPMADDGRHGDGAAGDGLWGAVIPARVAGPGQMVRWAIVATDVGGSAQREPPYPDAKRSPQYFGTVIDDPAVGATRLPVLHWFMQNATQADSDAGGRASLFFDGEFYDNVGVNLHGQSTRGFPKRSYDVDFNPGNKFRWRDDQPRVDDLNLLTTWADKSHLRNVLAYETYAQAGAPGHFAFPVRVQQNGRFHSVANLVENGDDNFLRRLGLDEQGALYKMYNIADSTSGAEKKTRKNEGVQDLAALLTALAASSSQARQAVMFDQIDLPEVVSFLAARAITGDTDCCHKNYYLYRDTNGSGEWQAFPWDVDLSFGRVWTCGNPCLSYFDETIYTNTGLSVGDGNRVFSVVLNTPSTRQMYLRRVRTLMDRLVQPPGVAPDQDRWRKRTTELRDWIATDAALDLAKWGTWGRRETITQAVDRIHREYLPGRRQYLFGTLTRNGTIPASQAVEAEIRIARAEARVASGTRWQEYLVLTNAGAQAVDISDWSLEGGVRFRFKPGTVIPARSEAYVSPDRRAFRSRSASPKGGERLLVLGDFSGELDARGETIVLRDDTGRQVHSWAFPGDSSAAQRDLRITEMMVHPMEAGEGGAAAEFVELVNRGSEVLDLSGVRFTEGITFDFAGAAMRTLAPGERVLVVRDRAAFTARYGAGLPIAGVYEGSLDNAGERVRLEDGTGEPVLDFSYDPAVRPAIAGQGFALEVVDEGAGPEAWSESGQWRPSARMGGTPGAASPGAAAVPAVVVNEVLTHTDPPQLDSVELFNASATSADISGWWLTDDATVPRKFRIPEGTVLAPSGFVVFDERHFNTPTDVPGSFTFSSHGEEVWLFASDRDGALTGYGDGFRFEAAANGESFGRWTNRVGEIQFPAQVRTSLGATNAGPRVGPVVITEIHYAPASGEAPFVELKNIGGSAVALFDPEAPTHGWRLGGVDFEFPTGLSLPAGGILLVVGDEPTAFRIRHAVPASVPVLGPWSGTLQRDGERLTLERPDPPDVLPDGTVFVPWIVVDAVRYNDRPPWPVPAAGFGASLERIRLSGFGDDPANWRASPGPPNPGIDGGANRAPSVGVGADLALAADRFPVSVALAGIVVDDGLPEESGSVEVRWERVAGSEPVEFDDERRTNAVVRLPAPGLYALRLVAFDGASSQSADLKIEVRRPEGDLTLVPAGASWRYFAEGRAPSMEWRRSDFVDVGWSMGEGQLGYGDGDERTVLPGTIGGARLLTAYFRRHFAVPDAAAVKSLTMRLLRDDGAAVWVNGVSVHRSNLPEGELAYDTAATATVAGTDESAYVEVSIDPRVLTTGDNVVAVEVHQQSAGSSDLSFDLELRAVAEPENSAPTVSAGPDRVLTPVEARSVRVAGQWSDDGLPRAVNLAWNQLEGPAAVAFDATNRAAPSVSFPIPGAYRLRFAAFDGELGATDEVGFLVTESDPSTDFTAWRARHFSVAELGNVAISGEGADPDGDGQSNLNEFRSGTLPRDGASVLRLTAESGRDGSIRLLVSVVAGRTYRVEWREAVGIGTWAVLRELAAPAEDGVITVTDPEGAPSRASRFYRVVTP